MCKKQPRLMHFTFYINSSLNIDAWSSLVEGNEGLFWPKYSTVVLMRYQINRDNS